MTGQPWALNAIRFGARLDPAILQILETYCTHPVRYFEAEQEALAWLREQ